MSAICPICNKNPAKIPRDGQKICMECNKKAIAGAAISGYEPEPWDGPIKEYKAVTFSEGFFKHQFNEKKVTDFLNTYARAGWRVITVEKEFIPGLTKATYRAYPSLYFRSVHSTILSF